jgi:hypothetical protein
MKSITGILITYALVFPSAPAAAQGDLGRQVERIVSSALTLAADALDDLVDERDPRAARQRDRDDRGPEYTDKFEKTVKIGRNGRLELMNYSGDVEVTGSTGDDVRITATKVTHASSEQTARAALSAMMIDVTERPGVVTVSAQPTRGRSNGVEVNYVIAVPAGTSVELRTFSGDVTIRSVSGGDVRLKSYSGDVVVKDGKLTGVEIDCTSGDVAIEQVESDRIQVSSLSGDIVYKGKLSKSGRYELRSNSGDIQVVTDGGASFNVQAATFSGDVTSDFPMKLGIPSSFAGGRGARRNNDITGVVNDGGAQLSLHSLSGDILISKR